MIQIVHMIKEAATKHGKTITSLLDSVTPDAVALLKS